MKITSDEIIQAYSWLKREVYYDTINLFIRNKISEFEFGDVEKKLEDIRKILNSIKSEKDIEFTKILDQIDFRVLPKVVKKKTSIPKSNNYVYN